MMPSPDRNAVVSSIKEAVASGASLAAACKEMDIHPRTYKRWPASVKVKEDGPPNAERRPPSQQLTEAEVARILAISNSPEYKNMPPSQIIPALADKGIYIASAATFYRGLKKYKQLHHRGRSQAPCKRPLTTHEATEANQLWSWDITWLAGPVLG